MYAILRSGGKQMKVSAGDVVRVEKPSGKKLS
jgi:ribosomal protein L21